MLHLLEQRIKSSKKAQNGVKLFRRTARVLVLVFEVTAKEVAVEDVVVSDVLGTAHAGPRLEQE